MCYKYYYYLHCEVYSYNYNFLVILQRVIGDVWRVSQATACSVIHHVSRLLATHLKAVVTLPATPGKSVTTQRKFYAIAQFPGVVGLVDGCQVRIENPGGGQRGSV